MDADTLKTLMEDEEKFINKWGNKLRCDQQENDYHLFNRILGLTPNDVWAKCEDAKDYVRTMYEIMYPIIKTQKKYLQEQSEALVEFKALDKAKLKKKIREYEDKLVLAIQENNDMLKTNALMIEKLKQNGLYDGEGTAFGKVTSEEEAKAKISELPTRKRL